MRARSGFTLLETIVVLAVLAVVLGLAWAAWTPSAAKRTARGYLQTVQGARIAALAGTPASVRWDPDRHAFLVRHGDPGCSGDPRQVLAPDPPVAVTRRLRDGVAWLPDGTGRACSGGGVFGGRVRFEDRRSAWDVVVASTGRLRLEAAP
ncbi:MAG: prepilin-type N-terminal cleavage/methylation domain-containing protein [Trueperaceae bacterium]|nr:prepilin-type N-terminal cleavage/methylation domain-containing protein [Trueperaceae bacterium]